MKYIVFCPEYDYEIMENGLDEYTLDSLNRKIVEADNKRDAVYIRIAQTTDLNEISEKYASKNVINILKCCIIFCPETYKFESSKNYDFSDLEKVFDIKWQDTQRAKDEAEFKRLQEKLGRK